MNKSIIASTIVLVLCSLLLAFEAFDIGRLPTTYTRFSCPTRNMIYDIRQDVPIQRKNWPLLDSTIGPQHPERCLGHRIDG